MPEEKKTYEIELLCLNCADVRKYNIPYGQLLDTFRTKNPCTNCGCLNTLHIYLPEGKK